MIVSPCHRRLDAFGHAHNIVVEISVARSHLGTARRRDGAGASLIWHRPLLAGSTESSRSHNAAYLLLRRLGGRVRLCCLAIPSPTRHETYPDHGVVVRAAAPPSVTDPPHIHPRPRGVRIIPHGSLSVVRSGPRDGRDHGRRDGVPPPRLQRSRSAKPLLWCCWCCWYRPQPRLRAVGQPRLARTLPARAPA